MDYRHPDRRVLSGAIVRFGNGALVEDVDLLATLSCLRLRIEDTGLLASRKMVKRVSYLITDREVAHIRTAACEIATTAFVILRGKDAAKETRKDFMDVIRIWADRGLTVADVPPILPLGSSPQRHIRQTCVRFSWLRPFSHIWLHYSTRADAEVVCWKLLSGRNQLGQQDSSITEPRLHFFRHPREGGKFLDSWQVGFRSTLPGISPSDIKRLLSEDDQPQRVKIQAGPMEDYDEQIGKQTVAEMIRMHEIGGRVDADASWNYGNRTFMTADFDTEEQARCGVESFEDPLLTLGSQHIQAEVINSTQTKVSKEGFEAVRDEVFGMKLADVMLSAKSEIAAPDKYTIVRIQGVEKKKVVAATNQIEDILAGRIIKDHEGTPFRSSLLGSTGVAKMIEKEMKDAYGVLVMANKFKRELRYFGPPLIFKEVEKDVVELISSSSKDTFAYQLDRTEFLWMRRAGFETLKHALGDEVVCFDASIKPHVLKIFGSKEQYLDAQRIIRLHTARASKSPLEDASPTACAICYDEAEQPVNLPCGHRYCSSCFTHMCTSTNAPHMCTPSTVVCNTVIDLQSIEENLSSTAFETVLSNSFKHYTAQRPDEYHPCPTPDCENLYSPTIGRSTLETCNHCLEQTCTLCHEQHSGAPCTVETGIQTADQKAFQTWVEGADVKQCPNCRAHIEKNYGCDHIECMHCNTHICWVCLETFPGSGETYKHLEDMHGGNGLVQALNAELIAEDALARRVMEAVLLDEDGGNDPLLADVMRRARARRREAARRVRQAMEQLQFAELRREIGDADQG